MLQNWTAAIVNKVYVAWEAQSLIGHHGNCECCWSLGEEEASLYTNTITSTAQSSAVPSSDLKYYTKVSFTNNSKHANSITWSLFFFPLREYDTEGNEFRRVQNLVVDRVTRKIRDLGSSGLKAVKLIVKHSIAARGGAVGCQQTIFFFKTFAKKLALDQNHILAMNLKQQLFWVCGVFYHAYSGIFSENTDGKNELLRFWLCLFQWHLLAVILQLIITDCGATNTSLCILLLRREKKNAWNEFKRGGNKVDKKLYSERDKFDIKLCEVAFHSLNVTLFGGISIDCQISAGESRGY